MQLNIQINIIIMYDITTYDSIQLVLAIWVSFGKFTCSIFIMEDTNNDNNI